VLVLCDGVSQSTAGVQVTAELMSGTLHVSFTTDPLIIGTNLDDGDWHQLNISIITGTATVQLDGSVMQASVNDVVYGPLLLGSMPVSNSDNFTGCVRSLTINNAPINLDVKVPYSANDPPFATAGCPREENCSPNPCRNGVCGSAWDDFSCRCSNDFTGPTCSECKCLS